jgi:hypothetical protein
VLVLVASGATPGSTNQALQAARANACKSAVRGRDHGRSNSRGFGVRLPDDPETGSQRARQATSIPQLTVRVSRPGR